MFVTSENFISQGGLVDEISPKSQSEYFHAGRIILNTLMIWGVLKSLDTIGNCQRQVFPLGVSQYA